MEVMKDKDTLINVRNQNHEKLLTELESLVVSLVLIPEFMNDKDTLINVRNQNHEKLLTELESLVVSLLLQVNLVMSNLPILNMWPMSKCSSLPEFPLYCIVIRPCLCQTRLS